MTEVKNISVTLGNSTLIAEWSACISAAPTRIQQYPVIDVCGSRW